MRPKYFIVAHISRPRGLKGEVEVMSLTDFPERFSAGQKFYPSPPVPGIEFLEIDDLYRSTKGFVMKFKGIDSREEAEKISGRDLLAPSSEIPELPQGEFWVSDIVGMEVFTTGDVYLGRVSEVLRTGSNDVYVVQNGKEHLIPATKEVVKDISLQDRKIVIEPIPGLLEET